MTGDYPVYLAPLAGISDAAMRHICLQKGPCLTFTEMVSVNGLKYQNAKTNELLSRAAEERTVGVQLFGSDERTVADIARALYERAGENIREINLNMGCPAPKIVKNGEGAALMLDLKKAARMIEWTAKAVPLPVTVKFRKGFDDAHQNALAFARMAQESGAAQVYVHGRTREQYYSGKADWEIIGEIKSALRIPVIGNGDIFCAQDAWEMRRQTGCDGVMVARGALGNPFIFAQIDHYFKTGQTLCVPTAQQRVEACLAQLAYAAAQKGEKLACAQMRKHAAYYLKGLAGAAPVRARVVCVQTIAEYRQIFEEYLKKNIAFEKRV